MLASQETQVPVVKLLMDAGARTDIKNQVTCFATAETAMFFLISSHFIFCTD
jgi:hypothetical protein